MSTVNGKSYRPEQELRDLHEIDRIMMMSDEEIRAELLADGVDPDEAAAAVGKVIKEAIEKYK